MEKANLEQRIAIKFCAKLGETATETYSKILKVYGSASLSRPQVFRWHKQFKEGRENVEDEERVGRPVEVRTDANAQRVRSLIREDRRLTVRMVSSELGINRETVRQILINDFGMRKVCAKMVPKNLSAEQKQHRMALAQDCLEQVENDPTLLDRVITGDESWFFQYDPETKRQSSQWLSPNTPRPKKARMSKSRVKTMIITFFDSRGIVHKEFVPLGQTVNQHFYREVLERLRKRVLRVRPDIANTWILHHDNAPCHTALSVLQYLTSKGITVLPQPPYSPDMSPCDFFLFPRMKLEVKGTHFESIEAIQAAVTRVLMDIPVEAFQKCYDAWKMRWARCIAAQGDYFEGDRTVVE
ncbi:protein GVQW3-like [Daktulosphaira vitifoliae]|uniref:protein GVQW3-like n=1 Tax=Daktulosphaira vitifoliae TaxID=58002 RepID=UPI0021A9F2D0|nr:protein GVQW3-like [Daktulosphaira vitifoliae]XP_050533662.1 protein GVQW3-like [Daktulosphaira vitifoliae]